MFHKPDSKVQQWIRRRRQEDYEWWSSLSTSANEAYIYRIALSLDRTASYVRRRFEAVWTLERLPNLKAQLLEHWHLDFDRLIAIGQKLRGIEELAELDAALCAYLAPEPNQQVPSAVFVRDFLRVKLAPFSWEPPADAVRTRELDEERACLEVTTTHACAELMLQRIRDLAQEWQCSPHEAIWNALMGQGANVVVNTYRREGSQAITTVKGVPLPVPYRDHLEADARIRMLDQQESKGYRFSENLKQSIIARDGHCRFPGCSVPAHACDIDHVVEYNRGGSTSIDNGQLLCRRHHNLKTEKKVQCSMAPGGTVTWNIFGKEVVTKPLRAPALS